eukprot:2425114-Alexandrium_andersonii.AAC.1
MLRTDYGHEEAAKAATPFFRNRPPRTREFGECRVGQGHERNATQCNGAAGCGERLGLSRA